MTLVVTGLCDCPTVCVTCFHLEKELFEHFNLIVVFASVCIIEEVKYCGVLDIMILAVSLSPVSCVGCTGPVFGVQLL